MPLQRYRVALSNWPGQPGIATHYLGTTVVDYAPIRTFWSAIINQFPNGFTAQFASSVDVINEATGQLISSLATTPGAAVASSTAANAYSGTSGAVIRWGTSAFQNGNRVVGRTFCVPLDRGGYDSLGSLNGTTQTALQTAGAALISAYGDGLKVWSRPFKGRTNDPSGKPDIPARAGAFFTVLTATVPDVAVVLRSRRS